MTVKRTILLIENNSGLLEVRKVILEQHGYNVYAAATLDEAEQIIKTRVVHLIITDIRVTDDDNPRDISGLTFARNIAPEIPKIVQTGFPSYAMVREALAPQLDGPPLAIDFISKAEGVEALLKAIGSAFENNILLSYPQFKVEGALTDSDSDVYIAREAEREVIASLKKMDYLLIIEPRQQGKTSLINYLLRSPKLIDKVFVYIYVATLDYSTQSSWLHSLCTRILEQLSKSFPDASWPKIPETYSEWRSFLSELSSFFITNSKNLVIALDELGTTIPNAIGFFSVLRDIFTSRQAEPNFRHITFLLVGTFHPRDLVKDESTSPFNIARRVRLHDFTLEQVKSLISEFGFTEEQSKLIPERVYYWTSGQPYLTQRICSYLNPSSTIIDVDVAIDRLRREDENHLPPLVKRILSDQALQNYIARILDGEKIKFYPTIDQVHAKLELLGIVKSHTEGFSMIRNRIYEETFRLMWGRNRMEHSYQLTRAPQNLDPTLSAELLDRGEVGDSSSTRIADYMVMGNTRGSRSRAILVIATEWDPRHGGLSSFNRDLCLALTDSGHRVVCAVPTANDEEYKNARKGEVDLVKPPLVPGLEAAGTYSLLQGIELPEGFKPEIILGHDRKTGPLAVALSSRFPDVRRLHFIHTRPEDIEWYKDALGEDDAAFEVEDRKELQRNLAGTAQLVAAVGPDLYRAAQTLLYNTNPHPSIVRVDPGFKLTNRPSQLPPEIHCLVLGRAEDFDLKGLDIAAMALGNVVRRNKVDQLPRLIVRGAPQDTGAKLRRRLSELAGGMLVIEVREYTPNVARLRDDILSASLMLMPSRSEGFGLVGLEAIAAAIPILVSRRSGLATLLDQYLGKAAEHFLVDVSDNLDRTVNEWERQIEATLMNRNAAFQRAEELRRDLAQTLTWANAVSTLEAAWEPLFQE